jgi:hypothetical protein
VVFVVFAISETRLQNAHRFVDRCSFGGTFWNSQKRLRVDAANPRRRRVRRFQWGRCAFGLHARSLLAADPMLQCSAFDCLWNSQNWGRNLATIRLSAIPASSFARFARDLPHWTAPRVFPERQPWLPSGPHKIRGPPPAHYLSPAGPRSVMVWSLDHPISTPKGLRPIRRSVRSRDRNSKPL